MAKQQERKRDGIFEMVTLNTCGDASVKPKPLYINLELKTQQAAPSSSGRDDKSSTDGGQAAEDAQNKASNSTRAESGYMPLIIGDQGVKLVGSDYMPLIKKKQVTESTKDERVIDYMSLTDREQDAGAQDALSDREGAAVKVEKNIGDMSDSTHYEHPPSPLEHDAIRTVSSAIHDATCTKQEDDDKESRRKPGLIAKGNTWSTKLLSILLVMAVMVTLLLMIMSFSALSMASVCVYSQSSVFSKSLATTINTRLDLMEKLLTDNITSFMEGITLLTSKTEVLDSVDVALLQSLIVLNSINVSLLNDDVHNISHFLQDDIATNISRIQEDITERIIPDLTYVNESISTLRDAQSSLTSRTDKLEGNVAVLGEPYSSCISNRSECSVRQNISDNPYLYNCFVEGNVSYTVS